VLRREWDVVALYFNAYLEGTHFGVDGLTTIVISASERHRAYGLLPREDALNTLAAIGRVGFTGHPVDRKKFGSAFINSFAPLRFWHFALKQLRKTPEALAGAFFVYLITEELNEGETLREEEAMQMRQSIRDLALNSKAIKRLDFFPRIAALAAGTVLSKEGVD
jgi:hypothetical protein